MLLSNKSIWGMWPAKKHGNWSRTGGPAFALSAADSRGWLSAPLAESLRPDHLRQHVHNMHAWLPVSHLDLVGLKNSYWCYCIIYSGNQLQKSPISSRSGSTFFIISPQQPQWNWVPQAVQRLALPGPWVSGYWPLGGLHSPKRYHGFSKRIWFCRLL